MAFFKLSCGLVLGTRLRPRWTGAVTRQRVQQASAAVTSLGLEALQNLTQQKNRNPHSPSPAPSWSSSVPPQSPPPPKNTNFRKKRNTAKKINLIPALIPIRNKPVKAEIRLIPVLFLFHVQNCCERDFSRRFLHYSCVIPILFLFWVNFPNFLKTVFKFKLL